MCKIIRIFLINDNFIIKRCRFIVFELKIYTFSNKGRLECLYFHFCTFFILLLQQRTQTKEQAVCRLDYSTLFTLFTDDNHLSNAVPRISASSEELDKPPELYQRDNEHHNCNEDREVAVGLRSPIHFKLSILKQSQQSQINATDRKKILKMYCSNCDWGC